jgi:hypothetical protein
MSEELLKGDQLEAEERRDGEEKPTRERVLADRAQGLAHRAGALWLALRGMGSHLENGDVLAYTEIAAVLCLAGELGRGLWDIQDALMSPGVPLSRWPGGRGVVRG